MKCQALFAGMIRKNIISLSSAEIAKKVLKITCFFQHTAKTLIRMCGSIQTDPSLCHIILNPIFFDMASITTIMLLMTSLNFINNTLELRDGCMLYRGWSGGAKVSCILCHRGVQMILAYSWARPAILVAGKGRGGCFLFHLFLHFHSCFSFFL